MEVMAPPIINAMNGSSVKLSCTFNSCYKVENKQFSLNWTYQACMNCSEELVSASGLLGTPACMGCPGHLLEWGEHGMVRDGAWLGGTRAQGTPTTLPTAQFLQFRMKIMNKQLERFGNRVEFTGNPTKNDVSFTLNNVQLEDEGTYNCYVLNPPDRQRGHASISLKVLTEGQCSPILMPRGTLGCRVPRADLAPCPQNPQSAIRRWLSSWVPPWAASWLWSSWC